jgi:hypothetical protein
MVFADLSVPAELVADLIHAAGNAKAWSTVQTLLGRLLHTLYDTLPRSTFTSAWLPALRTMLSTPASALALDHLKSGVLPTLMRIDPTAFPTLMTALNQSDHAAIVTLAICARQANVTLDTILTTGPMLRSFVHHDDLAIVSDMFALLCQCNVIRATLRSSC